MAQRPTVLCFPHIFYFSLTTCIFKCWRHFLNHSVCMCVWVCVGLFTFRAICSCIREHQNGVSKCLLVVCYMASLLLSAPSDVAYLLCVYIIHCEIVRILQEDLSDSTQPAPCFPGSRCKMIYVCFWLRLCVVHTQTLGRMNGDCLKNSDRNRCGKPGVFDGMSAARQDCCGYSVHYLCEKANRCRRGCILKCDWPSLAASIMRIRKQTVGGNGYAYEMWKLHMVYYSHFLEHFTLIKVI